MKIAQTLKGEKKGEGQKGEGGLGERRCKGRVRPCCVWRYIVYR